MRMPHNYLLEIDGCKQSAQQRSRFTGSNSRTKPHTQFIVTNISLVTIHGSL